MMSPVATRSATNRRRTSMTLSTSFARASRDVSTIAESPPGKTVEGSRPDAVSPLGAGLRPEDALAEVEPLLGRRGGGAASARRASARRLGRGERRRALGADARPGRRGGVAGLGGDRPARIVLLAAGRARSAARARAA